MKALLLPFAVVVAAATPVRAQSASAQAEILFRQGRDLMTAKKYSEACTAFEASQKLDAAVTTLLNLADCREKNGQLASALAEFSNAEKLAQTTGGANGEKFGKVAHQHIARLQPKISQITINVPADHRVAGLVVTRNGATVDPVTWNVPLPADGGSYEIGAKAPGHESWTKTVKLKAAVDLQVVEVPALAEDKTNPTPTPNPNPNPSPNPTPNPNPSPNPNPNVTADLTAHASPGGPSRGSAYLAGGAAIALLGGALVFDLWGDSLYDKAKSDPDPMKQLDYWDQANTRRYVAEGLAVAGVATAGITVWLWMRSGHASSSEQALRARHVVPVVAGEHVGIVYGGAW